MKISFHGAAQMVTGSKHLLELKNGTKILLDCGMFQGNPKEAAVLNLNWGFVPAQIDYLILSHAHIDHCGLIPKLIKDGYNGKVYCTSGTFDLARILLLDSAHIQEQDAFYVNKKRARQGEGPIKPLYTIKDAHKAFEHFEEVPYHQLKEINENVKFQYTDVGHILGATAVHITITESGKQTQITFSGDVGRYNDELLRSPEKFPQADYLLLESTYGDSLHEDVKITENKLLEAMSMGIPVITSTLANNAIGATHGKNIWIADTPQKVAESISFLLNNTDLAMKIGQNAREWMVEEYSWDKQNEYLLRLFQIQKKIIYSK
jgi:metallo-beta-lactamase family protein